MSDDRGPSVSSVLLLFAAGAAAGAAIALLTTTKTGKELRESIASWAKDGQGRDLVERAARSVRDAFETPAKR